MYYYISMVDDPMDKNYKLSRNFEMSVLGNDKVVKMLNDKFVCSKVELSFEGDQKELKNQARIEVWSSTGKQLGVISQKNMNLLNGRPFMQFLAMRSAKNAKLVKKEIARITKLRKEREREIERQRKAEETASK